MMGFNILNTLNSATLAEASRSEEYKDIVLDYRDIIVTDHNKYSIDEIQELATGILLTGGIQEPLIVGRVDDGAGNGYRLISGHRRLQAVGILAEEGRKEFEKIPCRYKDMSETQFRIELLCGNTFNRKMSDYDLMMQAQEWKEVLTKARKEKLIILEEGERIRDYVAVILGESTGKIGQLNAINTQATPEVKEKFKTGEMGITSAYAVSQLDPEEQKGVVSKIDGGEDVRSEEIKRIIEEKRKQHEEEEQQEEDQEEEQEQESEQDQEKRSLSKQEEHERKIEDQQRRANVSDTDTNEDEKGHAKRLHVLKMLENYYTYMSGEELELLERILEDCKRRKREYAIDEE